MLVGFLLGIAALAYDIDRIVQSDVGGVLWKGGVLIYVKDFPR